jgi:hypothetical protein
MNEYTLTESLITKDEMSLSCEVLGPDGFETRAAVLARSLRGRFAKEARCFYFTPVRARKWELLYRHGFWASQKQIGGAVLWRWHHRALPKGGMELADAMQFARALELATAKPVAVEVEFASP